MKKSLFTALAVGLGLTANVIAQVPNYVPTNGLVGWWPFNGNANDESGNGNNGTVNGATLTTDRFGIANKAYSFDGVDDKINLPFGSNIQGNNPRTISSWFNINSLIDYTHTIYKGGNNGDGNDFSIWITCINNQVRFHIRRFTNDIITNYFDLAPSEWHSFVVTYDGTSDSNTKLYFDGIEIQNFLLASIGLTYNTQATSPCFGNLTDQLSNDHFFNGSLDDIGIWNRTLSDCEIQDLYKAQLGSFSHAVVSVNPTSSTIGSSVSLNVDSPISSLQWQTNPSNVGWLNLSNNNQYSGVTNDTLVVSNLQLSNHNQPFRVLACGDTSNIATIQIADTCITNVTIYDTLLTTVTDTLIINTTLGLPAPNNENTILIYPNPASDHITIDNGNYTAMAGYTIRIENNAGQQVFQSSINQQQFYVDLSTWSGNGLYFVHLIDPQNNTVTVRKIVLQ